MYYFKKNDDKERELDIDKSQIEPILKIMSNTDENDEIYYYKFNLVYAIIQDIINQDYSIDILFKIYKTFRRPFINKIQQWAASKIIACDDENALDFIINETSDGDSYVRLNAITALGNFKNKKAIMCLQSCLSKDSDYYNRSEAATMLGKIGDIRAIEGLIVAINDEDPNVQYATIKSLSKFRDNRVVDALLHKLRAGFWSGDYSEGTIVEALDQLGWKPDRSEYGACYWITKDNWVKCQEIGSDAIKPLIKTLMCGEDRNIRVSAATTLENLGWKPDKTEDGAKYWIVKENWDECVNIGPAAVNPLMHSIEFCCESNEKTFCHIKTLGRIKDPKSIPFLVKRLWYEDYHFEAYNALITMGETAIPGLIELLDTNNFSTIQDSNKMNILTDGIFEWQTRFDIICILNQLNWKPDNQNNDIFFNIAEKNWDICITVGDAAILPLIKTLQFSRYYYNGLQIGSAHALVKMYNSKKLTEDNNNLVSSNRKLIEKYCKGF